jgi:hypothetical protein
MKNLRSLFAIGCVTSTMIAGCGGGGGGGSPTPSPTPAPAPTTATGVFVDAPVAGLTYASQNAAGNASTTGVTGQNGSFVYVAGGTVTFSVGGIVLGTAPALPVMTPITLALVANPTANASSTSPVTMCRFLASISSTPLSSGQLTITPAMTAAAAGLTVDFSTVSDAELTTIAQTISPGATLVDAPTCANHLANTVYTAFAGNYGGTFSGGGQTGTWTLTIAAGGTVSGTAVNNTNNSQVTIAGALASGTTYTGTAGEVNWTGNLDITKAPVVFSGTYVDTNNSSITGTFTGTATSQ